ncbi:MAG TPA: phosphoenolpyruvate carboxykinase (ATP) [candidate division Zixibacteria bacterium]|nr:phosphoenolpyruvate carboxykinase (ATP) [candidate division Zixibacteria bacterium]
MSVKGSLSIKSKLSSYRTTIETAFFGNNVRRVNTVAEAYELATNSPGTIVTDQDVIEPELHGFPKGAKVLVFNDGAVFGRCAQARRLAGTEGVDEKTYTAILREAIYNMRFRKQYHATAYIGLHEDFMVKANFLTVEGFENNLLNWLLNFQVPTPHYDEMYARSAEHDDLEILIVSDPYWSHPDFPLGLAFFDPEHNAACILGMRYFGEHKKGTLTMAWGTANRHGFASCHAGLKRYDESDFVAAFFGLSGSGKSTLTHAKHGGKYETSILHDDAFVVDLRDGSTIALEPSYFDKTADYAIGEPDNKFILTAQNVGIALDENGKKTLVTEDIRQGNGRAIKSKLWSPNRVDRIDDELNAIFWLMKDPTLPPLTRLEGPAIGSTMGLTLATKRTSAERVVGTSLEALVVEPYANPFRTWPLAVDYDKFKFMIEKGVKCYVLNTGAFQNKDIPKEITLGLLEQIIEGRDEFVPWPSVPGFSYWPVRGFEPDMTSKEFRDRFKIRMNERLQFIESRAKENGGFDKLPNECAEVVKGILSEL